MLFLPKSEKKVEKTLDFCQESCTMSNVVIDMEIEMTKDYGMFTDAGNELVDSLVEFSKTFGLSDTAVLAMMGAIGKDEAFAEITDTAVREEIGCALGWYE